MSYQKVLSQTKDSVLNGFATPEQECPKQILMKKVIGNIAARPSIEFLQDITKFINSFESVTDVQTTSIQDLVKFKTDISDPVGGCIVKSVIQNECNYVGLIIDFQEQLIYFFDIKCREIEYYTDLKSELDTNYKSFDIRYIYHGGDAAAEDENNSSFSTYYGPVLTILIWAMIKFYDNEYVWYLLVKRILYHPNLAGDCKEVYDRCLSSLYKEDMFCVNTSKEHTIVRNIIREAANKCMDIKELKKRVSLRYSAPLGKKEQNFIEEKYIKDCTVEFFNQVEKDITGKINDLSGSLSSFIEQITHMREISQLFEEIASFKVMKQCTELMTKRQHKKFILELKDHCFKTLLHGCDTFNTEIEFLNESKKMLRELFIGRSSENEDQLRKANENWGKYQDLYRSCNQNTCDQCSQFIRSLQTTEIAEFQSLKSIALSLDVEKSFHLIPSNLKKLLETFEEPVKLQVEREGSKKKYIFEGNFIKLDDVKKATAERKSDDVYQIEVIANQLICINVDLKMSGMNIVLVSPSIHVGKEHSIDVSGLHGENLYSESAPSGKTLGADGLAGEPGDAGQDGGNIYICAEQISNSQDLKIISNGGNGGDGQNGGNGVNGVNGRDGKEISREQLKNIEYESKYMLKRVIFKKEKRPQWACFSDKGHHEGTIEGCRIMYDIKYHPLFYSPIFESSYCIHFGGKGTPGYEGGMGGCGGKGGDGGRSGDVDINCKYHQLSVERYSGKNGAKGNDGTGGKGGINGRNGFDTARIKPPQFFGFTVHYYGPARLKLSYVERENADEYAVLCAHESEKCGSARYAKITEVSKLHGREQRSCGERLEKNKTRQSTQRIDESRHKKSIMITKSMVTERYSHMLQAGYNSKLQKVDLTVIRNAMAEIESTKLHMTEVKYKLEQSGNGLVDEHQVDFLQPCLINIKMKDACYIKKKGVSFGSSIKDEFHVLGIHLKNKLVRACDNYSITLEELKIVKSHLQKDAIDDPREIKDLTKCTQKLRAEIDKRRRPKFMKIVAREEQNLVEEACQQLVEIYEILLIKYRFATLARILEETKKDVEYHQEKIKSENRKFLASALKKRLIHLNFDSIKGILNTRTLIDIDGYFDGRKKEIEANLFWLSESVRKYEMESNEVDLNSGIDQSENQTFDELSPEESGNENERFVDMESRKKQPASNHSTRSKSYYRTRNSHKQESGVKIPSIALLDQVKKTAESTRQDHKHHHLFAESLEKLKEIGSDRAKLLMDVVMLKQFVDGVHLSHHWFDLFIKEVAALGDCQTVKIASWIVSTTHMSKWMAEYTVEQSLCTGHLDVEKEEQMRCSLYSIQDVKWIPALWKYIFKTEFFQLPNCYKILELLKDADYDNDLMHQMDCTNLEDWELMLNDHFSCKRLLMLPIDWTSDKVTEAQIYLDELKKVHGEVVYNKIYDALRCANSIELDDVMMLLHNLYHDNWQLTERLLDTVRLMPSIEWKNVLTPDLCQVDSARSLAELVNLMKEDSKNSFYAHNAEESTTRDKGIAELDEVQGILERTLEDGKVAETFGREFIENWEKNFHSKVVTMAPEDKKLCTDQVFKWSKKVRDKVKGLDLNQAEKEHFLFENISEIFSHVEIGISLVTNFKLKPAQRLAIMLLLVSKSRGLLAQVATGEGKTIIITAFCIMKNLVGSDVDVISSSSVLAERDATEQKNIYDLFGTTVSHNCSNDDEKRTEAYKSNIVYGEIASFQRDLLLQQFYNKNVLGKRGFQNIVVDEVDSMLLDKAENVLYLSHDIVDLKDLEPLFVYIWTFVHGKGMVGTESDISQVHAAIMNAMFGSISKEYFFSALHCHEDGYDGLEKIWKFLIDKRIIDSKHRIMPVTELKNNQFELELPQQLKCEVDQDIEGVILDYLKNNLRKGILFKVPSFLEEFIDLHLMDWIKSAFTARFMEERKNYIIDINRSDIGTGESVNVVIMDTDTGVEQFNMQWSEALHIFIQLKHSCRISLETLKAVFISNIEFFKHYQPSIFGLTGTLGTKKERDILQDMYNVNYVTVPTFRPKRFHHHADLIFDDEQKWLEKTVENAITIADTRPVLMVCEDIKRVDMFERNIKLRMLKDLKVYVYKHSYEKLDIVKDNKEIEDGCIIIATNLAGRGTDLKISKKISELGGLHVILTYMPRNIRISEQAFGRAARKGDRGSGQFSIYHYDADETRMPTLLRILRLKSQKNAREQAKLGNFREHYEKCVQVQEKYFTEFQEMYNGIQTDLTKKGENLSSDTKLESANWKNEFESKKSIVLKACLDRWAFWLDSLSRRIANGNEDSESYWNSFKAKIKRDFDPSCVLRKIESPSQLMNLGKAFMRGKDYSKALEVFGKLCENEPCFSESAHYYSAHCIIKKSNLKDKDSKKQLCHHLQKADEILERKSDVYSRLNAMVKSVRAFYGKEIDSFIVCDSYEKQKANEISILEIFRGTIREMQGHDISMQKLISVGEDVLVAKTIFESRELLQGPRFIDDKQSSTRYEELHDRYEFYASEIEQKINELREKKAEPKPEDFKGILPNREEFWDLLKEKNLISKEKCFVVIDKKKFESLAPELHEEIVEKVSQLKSSKEFEEIFRKKSEIQICETEETQDEEEEAVPICMFPEKIEDIIENNLIAIDKKDASEWDEIFRETLECYDLIHTCNIAFFKIKASRSTGLGKYDGIKKENFLEIRGVNKDTADEVFQIVEPCLVEHDLPNIGEINLRCHKKYETEVRNLMEKHHKYRTALMKLGEGDTTAFEDLPSKPHQYLWEDLIDLKIILPVQVRPDLDEHSAQMFLENKRNLKEKLDKMCMYFVYLCDFKQKSPLASFLYQWKSGMHKFDTIDSQLKDIREVMDKTFLQNAAEELALLSESGFDEIITLREQRWSQLTICRIVGIAVIGMVQIALGIFIELYTLGALTGIAGAFIGEGIGDIIFATEAAIFGHCSMKQYVKHKAISLAITISTVGLGELIARGAEASHSGCKTIGQQVAKKAGKEVTKRSIAKQVTLRVGKQLLEAAAIGVATGVTSRAVEKLIHGKLHEVCTSIIDIFRDKEKKDQLKDIIRSFCEMLGPEKAAIEVAKIGNKMMDFKISSIKHKALKAFAALCFEVGIAAINYSTQETATYTKTANVLSIVSLIMSTCLAARQTILAVSEIKEVCQKVATELPSELQGKVHEMEDKLDKVDHRKKYEIDENEVERIASFFQELSANKVKELLLAEIVSPFLKRGTYTILESIGNGIEKFNSRIDTKIQLFQFLRVRLDNDSTKLSIGEAKDQSHYAQMLREGSAPMGINEAQAISNVANRRIDIIVCNGIKRRTLPRSFTPTSSQPDGEPLVLYFHIGKSEENGHFSDSPRTRTSSSDQRESTSYNNCLLDTVSKMIREMIDRNKVVDEVERNVEIRKQVERGIHWHYIDLGGTGGVSEPEEEKDKKLEELKIRFNDALQRHHEEESHKKTEDASHCESFKYEEPPIVFKLKESDKKALRSKPQSYGEFLSDKSGKIVINHEEFAIEQVPHLIYRDFVDDKLERQHNFEGIEPYTWCDLYRHFRFDFRHFVFDESGVYGHLTSAASSTEMQGKDQKAITSTIMLHNVLAGKMLSTASPPDALKVCLQENLKAIGSREIFETKLKDNPNYFKGHFTATGHDLTIPEHCDEFFTGLQRTRYTIAAVLEKIGGEKNAMKLKNTDAEFESKLKTRLQSAKGLKELGGILKSREDCL